MLKATLQKIRHTTIVRCQGRIIVGENFAALRNAAMRHSSTDMVVLDLAGVRRVDAGGLGVLLDLRQWAEANSIRFKLMNVMPKVQRILKLTKLDRVFEFWSARDMFDLLCHAHSESAGVLDLPTSQNVAVWEPPAA
jgi:anti-anti-sigma factor